MKKRGFITIFMVLGLLFSSQAMAELTPVQTLGKLLYFDKDLSMNQNQACATCHHPSSGYADPLNSKQPYDFPVSLGSDTSLNGGRNAPTSSYAAFIPVFSWENRFMGGQFLDGRADTLKGQAKGPFLNPVEMAMADEAAVITALVDTGKKKAARYQQLFLQVFNIDLSAIDTSWNSPEVVDAYDKAAEAIGQFEQTFNLSPFTSKFDYYLAGKAALTAAELRGLEIFENPQQGNCSACHPSQARVTEDGRIIPPLLTDFSYHNLGVPKSTNPLISDFPIDNGLGARDNLDGYYPAIEKTVLPDGSVLFPTETGKFRVSSLRNISRTAPYSHNGFFATSEEIVHFLNTRDVHAENWPPPEVAENINMADLGALGLSPQDEADLVAFLYTLTDGYGNTTPANFILPPMTPLK